MRVQEFGFNIPLTKLRPVHSTWVLTTTCEDALPAHVMYVHVLMLKMLPLGTSGVCAIVTIEMQLSRSLWTVSSCISHFVGLGPMLLVQGFDIGHAAH